MYYTSVSLTYIGILFRRCMNITHIVKLITCIAVIAVAQVGCSVKTTAVDNTSTLDRVIERGFLLCGVSPSLPGFSFLNKDGVWSGLDVDICRAVAAAVLGDSLLVKYVPVSTTERFVSLQSGEVDILARNSSWTLSRDISLGIDFTAINYYDGQGFMVYERSKITSATELNGATLCMSTGTSTELNIADFFKAKGMRYTALSFDKPDEMVAAYENGRCDAFTSDISGLIVRRTSLKQPEQHAILPDVISKEPLSPVVRQGDGRWRDVVSWVIFAMINAEEIGLNSENVKNAQVTFRHHPIAMRLLGVEGRLGVKLGLDNKWAYNIIAQVGNYGESYDKHLGVDSAINMPRGVNKLWLDGGLMYAPPVL